MRLKVFGFGAVGRGFLPWVFPHDEFMFVDPNKEVRPYSTFMVHPKYDYEEIYIEPTEFDRPDIIFCCVGTRSCTKIADEFRDPSIPVYVLENDSRVVPVLRDMTGNDNIWFGIPDVITSNTAPKALLDHDSLAVVTERGYLYLPFGSRLPEGAQYLQPDMLERQWKAKLYLHNTPHCIAAYLGYQKGYTYIHECMADDEIRKTIEGVIDECARMVGNRYNLHSNFTGYYGAKEIARFSNPLLHDPITRVAREPLRKLGEGERLIGAARLCVQSNINPRSIIKGIHAALAYDNPDDPDYHEMRKHPFWGNYVQTDEPLSWLMYEPWEAA
jgi:mannitol-1-phosphate 5-dehydrogenase